MGHHPVDDAEPLGLLGRDHVGEQGQLLGLVEADEPGQDPRPTEVHAEAAAGEDLGEAGLITGHDQVAGQGHVHPGTGGHPVHLGDDRDHDRVERGDGPVDHVHRLELVHLLAATPAEVGPGAEPVTGTGHDHAADVGVQVDLVPGDAEFVPHGAVGRVLLLRPVHGDRHHTVVGDIDQQRFHLT